MINFANFCLSFTTLLTKQRWVNTLFQGAKGRGVFMKRTSAKNHYQLSSRMHSRAKNGKVREGVKAVGSIYLRFAKFRACFAYFCLLIRSAADFQRKNILRNIAPVENIVVAFFFFF